MAVQPLFISCDASTAEGALLICDGMVDVNVHFQDTVRLVQRLIDLRKENWVLAAYPVEDHGFVHTFFAHVVSDARLLSEISRSEYELWGSPYLFPAMLERVQLDPSLRVMFLNPGGRLLYSSDSADTALLGEWLDIPGIQLAQAGNEAALTNYSPFRLGDVYVDVLSPVNDPAGQVIGIVRVTYQLASIYELFSDFRLSILGVLVFSLLLGAFIGSGLAINIGRPVQQVTQAIYDLARGARQEALVEQGPEEMRDQIRAVNYLVERLQSLEPGRGARGPGRATPAGVAETRRAPRRGAGERAQRRA